MAKSAGTIFTFAELNLILSCITVGEDGRPRQLTIDEQADYMPIYSIIKEKAIREENGEQKIFTTEIEFTSPQKTAIQKLLNRSLTIFECEAKESLLPKIK